MTLRAALFLLPLAAALAAWEPDVRLTFDSAGSYTSRNSCRSVAALADTVHVAWYDLRDGNREIYYKRSTDCGATWSADRRLTGNTATSRTPSLALDGSDVHIVWYDERDGNREIYHKRSWDRGSSWTADRRLTADSSESYNASVAASGGNVHVCWMDDSAGVYPDIRYRRSTDHGGTWGEPVRLTENPARSYNPSVAAAGPFVHVVWADDRDGNWEVYSRRSTDSGATWEQEHRLTFDSAASVEPMVAAAGPLVFVTWCDERDGNQEVYSRRSTDFGATWFVEERRTTALNSSGSPAAAAAGGFIHLVWVDLRSGDMELYYCRSTDAGESWGPEEWLTGHPAGSRCPSVAAGGDAVHVAWYDLRDGNYEVYYKRDPTGNTAVAEWRVAARIGPRATVARAGRYRPRPSVRVFDVLGRRRSQARAGVVFEVEGGRARPVVLVPQGVALLTVGGRRLHFPTQSALPRSQGFDQSPRPRPYLLR